MAGPVIDDVTDESAPVLLQRLRAAGFELMAKGDRLRIRPAERVTPALRDRIAQHKPALLWALAPFTEFVFLKSGLVVPLPALLLALDLEARGFRMTLDANQQFQIEPAVRVTDDDRAAIARWQLHLGAIIACQAPEVG